MPDISYHLIQRHSAEHVELEFTGTLQKLPVLWHAHIFTLKEYYRQQQLVSSQAFIDVQVLGIKYVLTVAINLPIIDDAAIQRTIIMIRQYKRLQPGRHDYGDSARFNTDNHR